MNLRKAYEGRVASWEATTTVALSPKYLQSKPRFFLGAVAEEGVTTILNPRHLILSFIHPLMHLMLTMPPMCHAMCKMLKIEKLRPLWS